MVDPAGTIREGFIISRNRLYLWGRKPLWNRSTVSENLYTVYKYDAVRFESYSVARKVVEKLQKPGENWQIWSFNSLDGERTLIWPKQ